MSDVGDSGQVRSEPHVFTAPPSSLMRAVQDNPTLTVATVALTLLGLGFVGIGLVGKRLHLDRVTTLAATVGLTLVVGTGGVIGLKVTGKRAADSDERIANPAERASLKTMRGWMESKEFKALITDIEQATTPEDRDRAIYEASRWIAQKNKEGNLEKRPLSLVLGDIEIGQRNPQTLGTLVGFAALHHEFTDAKQYDVIVNLAGGGEPWELYQKGHPRPDNFGIGDRQDFQTEFGCFSFVLVGENNGLEEWEISLTSQEGEAPKKKTLLFAKGLTERHHASRDALPSRDQFMDNLVAEIEERASRNQRINCFCRGATDRTGEVQRHLLARQWAGKEGHNWTLLSPNERAIYLNAALLHINKLDQNKALNLSNVCLPVLDWERGVPGEEADKVIADISWAQKQKS